MIIAIARHSLFHTFAIAIVLALLSNLPLRRFVTTVIHVFVSACFTDSCSSFSLSTWSDCIYRQAENVRVPHTPSSLSNAGDVLYHDRSVIAGTLRFSINRTPASAERKKANPKVGFTDTVSSLDFSFIPEK